MTGQKFGIDYFLNNKFGKLQPIACVGRDHHGRRCFLCECDCGNKSKVTDSNLKGKTRSCGCLKADLIRLRMGKSIEHKKRVSQEWERRKKRWLDPDRIENRRERVRRYRKKHRDRINQKEKQRRAIDIQHRLRKNLRCRLYFLVKGNRKIGSAVKDLGCSVNFLKLHLEKLWESGMSWSNYGNLPGCWSIDHIFPLSKLDLTNKDEFLMACHFTNLRPMWHLQNLSKGAKIVS